MRKVIFALLLTAMIVTAAPSFAELQNVQVGGEIHLRGNWIRNQFASRRGPLEVRWRPGALRGRAIGDIAVISDVDWDQSPDLKFIEQMTKVNVKADFTDSVSAFIELASYDYWGEDFRSNHLTGVDGRANTTDDVEVYQAYIEANEMFGYPLRLRVGRQELKFGSEWLVGNQDFAFLFSGLSFDAIRLTYATDTYSIDAFASKLAENSPVEEDGDVDLYGVYASCMAVENMVFDAYWLWLRDSREIHDTPGFGILNWWEDLWNVDDYDVTSLHTVGLRAAGRVNALDFEAEAAYQFGDVDRVGALFRTGLYGDDTADVSEWAGRLEAGYSFDFSCHPRIFLGGAYFGGEDNRDISFWEWLCPFDRPEASVSFNRLFSDITYSGFFDGLRNMSNAYLIRGGVNAMPTEKLGVVLCVTRFESLDDFEAPIGFRCGRLWIPCVPALSFWTNENDGYLGTESHIILTYQYSEDLSFEAGWAHLFNGDAEGNYNSWNGLLFNGGSDDDDADYIYWGAKLCF